MSKSKVRLGDRISEAIAGLFGTQNSLIPPRRLINDIGGGDYQAIGNEFFRHFTTIGGLEPQHRVLDVGCGCGRMAAPMIPFLTEKGEYHGFDIMPDAIKWTTKHIASHHPRFHFVLADVYNKSYNPDGRQQAADYRFPYPDGYFDFTLLTSVFTHMFAADMKRYLSEIHRTLNVGGRCMISFFLLNSESVALMAGGRSSINFKYSLADCMTSEEEKPESAIAFQESFVRQCFAEIGLQIVEPIHFGKWPGRDKFLSYQDIVLATKV